MKKFLIFYYQKKTNKFESYSIFTEEQIKKLDDTFNNIIKKYNEDKNNSNYAKLIDQEDITEAFFHKESIDNIKIYVDEIKDSFRYVANEISNIRSSVDSFFKKIEENLEIEVKADERNK